MPPKKTKAQDRPVRLDAVRMAADAVQEAAAPLERAEDVDFASLFHVQAGNSTAARQLRQIRSQLAQARATMD